MPGAPESYADASIVIKVDPVSMFHEAMTALVAHSENIADRITAIVNVWNGLQVGWVGNTADEAQAFNDEWSAAISRLYGSVGSSESGILRQIAYTVSVASINYGAAEDAVRKMFKDILDALGSSSKDTNPGRDITTGPIWERTPQ